MKNINDVCVIVQARTQSTRVPNKMLRPFADSCLFEIALKKVLRSKVPKQNFYASVMDQELIEITERNGVNVFLRSEESIQEPVTLQKVFEWHNKLPFKHFVIVNACNPLLRVETINKFLDRFLEVESDGLFGVLEKVTFMYGEDGRMLNRFNGSDEHLATLETKMVERCYEAAHTLYAGSMEAIGRGVYMGTFKRPNDPAFFTLDELECFDIDWPRQFEIAEKIYQMERETLEDSGNR